MNAIAFLPAPQTEATEAEAPAFVIRSATVTRASLGAAMTTAASIAPRLTRSAIPILSNALIRACGDGLEVIATDMDVTFRTIVPGEVQSGFAVTVNAIAFRDLLKRSKAEDVTLTETEPGFVQVAMGGASARLQTIDAVDFPPLPTFKIPPAAEIEGEAKPDPETPPAPAPVIVNFPVAAGELARALAYVAPAISSEETRYYLNGIFMHFRADDVLGLRGLCFTATDGHRLHMRSLPALVPTNLPPVIVPRLVLDYLAKYLGKKASGNVRVTVKATLIRFTMPDGAELFSKLIDGTFPDYQRIIPQHNAHCITVQADALAETVKQVASVATTKRPAIRFSIEAAGVTCGVNDPDGGTSSASLAASVSEGCEMVVGFNAGYVGDICANIKGEAVWHLADNGSPALITSPSDPRGFMVVMPMRVKN